MSKKEPNEVMELPNSEPHKTKVLAFHLYLKHYDRFLEICEELEKFHSEILRTLVVDFIKGYEKSLGEEGKPIQPSFVNY